MFYFKHLSNFYTIKSKVITLQSIDYSVFLCVETLITLFCGQQNKIILEKQDQLWSILGLMLVPNWCQKWTDFNTLYWYQYWTSYQYWTNIWHFYNLPPLQQWMLPPCHFLLYSYNKIVTLTEETNRSCHSDTKS